MSAFRDDWGVKHRLPRIETSDGVPVQVSVGITSYVACRSQTYCDIKMPMQATYAGEARTDQPGSPVPS